MADPAVYLGRPAMRIDGEAKVLGWPIFPGDVQLQDMAYAVLVTSTVAKGRIVRLVTGPALDVSGVRDVLTYREVGEAVRPVSHLMKGG